MPPTITLTQPITVQRRPLSFSLNLSEISRSRTFKLVAEAITLLSLLTAAVLWTFAMPTL